MKVEVTKEFLEIPVGSIGEVVLQNGNKLPEDYKPTRAMWIKFDCKDMPVGICEPFEMHVKKIIRT